MKKIIIYVGTAILTFIIVVLAMVLLQKRKINNMINDFNKAFEGEKQSIVFYASSKCHFCLLEKPILKQIAKDYDLKYVEIDASLLNEKQKKDMIKKLGIEGATPTTAIVGDSKVKSLQVGYLDGNEYVDFFIESGILKEGSLYKPEDKINFIEYPELLNITDGVLVIGRPAMEECNELKKTINKISKDEKVVFNYLNLSGITAEEYYMIQDKLFEMNRPNYNLIKGDMLKTPMILVIKESKLVSLIEDTDSAEIVKKLKKVNIIK